MDQLIRPVFALLQQQPYIVTIAPAPPTHQTTLGDVIVASLMFVGAAVVCAAVLGAVLGLVIYLKNKRHPPELDHMPPVA